MLENGADECNYFFDHLKMLDKIVSKSTKSKTLAIKPSPATPLQQTVQVLPVSMNSGTGVPHPVIVTDQQSGPLYVISSSSTNQNADLVFSEQSTVQIPVTVENTEPVAELSPVVVTESVPKQSIPTSTPIGSNRRKAIAPKVRIRCKFRNNFDWLHVIILILYPYILVSYSYD